MLISLLISILLLAPAPRQLEDDPTLQDRIIEASMTQLHQQFPGTANRVKVRVTRLGGGLHEQLGVRVLLPPYPALPKAHVQARIHQELADGWQDVGWAMLYVSHFDSVGVTARQIKKDEELVPSDLRFTWLEITRFRGDPLTPAVLHALINQGNLFADRHLNEDRPLRIGDIRNAFDVQLGQSVIMSYKRDQFLLEFTCKARMQGFTGDEIKLYATATNRTYRARITGPGKAEWLETLE